MAATARKKVNPLLKLALEMGPLIIFFLSNARPEFFRPLVEPFLPASLLDEPNAQVYIATPLFMVATLVALVLGYVLTRHIPIMPLVSAVFVLIFGGLTLWLHDQRFIQMKPTLVNLIFGGLLLGGLVLGRSLLRYVLDVAFELTDEGWYKLTQRWGVYFIFLAVLNEIVWRNFSFDFWTNFKVFGIMPLTMVFAASQVPLMLRSERKAPAPEPETLIE